MPCRAVSAEVPGGTRVEGRLVVVEAEGPGLAIIVSYGGGSSSQLEVWSDGRGVYVPGSQPQTLAVSFDGRLIVVVECSGASTCTAPAIKVAGLQCPER